MSWPLYSSPSRATVRMIRLTVTLCGVGRRLGGPCPAPGGSRRCAPRRTPRAITDAARELADATTIAATPQRPTGQRRASPAPGSRARRRGRPAARRTAAPPEHTGPSSTCPQTTMSGGRRTARKKRRAAESSITSGQNVDPGARAYTCTDGARPRPRARPSRRDDRDVVDAASPSARLREQVLDSPPRRRKINGQQQDSHRDTARTRARATARSRSPAWVAYPRACRGRRAVLDAPQSRTARGLRIARRRKVSCTSAASGPRSQSFIGTRNAVFGRSQQSGIEQAFHRRSEQPLGLAPGELQSVRQRGCELHDLVIERSARAPRPRPPCSSGPSW